MKKLLLPIFLFFCILFLLTSPGKTPYDYFTRLSDAFLQGKYYLTENPSWLSELVPAGDSKYYIAYPPMPAIISMPFRFIFKDYFHQEYLAYILGAGIVILTILISWKIKNDKRLAIWSGLLIGLGSIVWFLSSNGSSWYLGQVTSAFFLSAALLEGLTRRRPFTIGVFLGAAYLSRIHTIISLPLFMFLLFKKGNIKEHLRKYLLLALGILPFIVFNFFYNYIRFGVIWDKAYFLLPQILNEVDKPWFLKGVASILYIPQGIKAALWSFPKIMKNPPYIIPSLYSLSIWITTPAFIFSFWAKAKEPIVKFLWLSVISIFLVVASHGGVGWSQFGYRFAVDFYPFLTLLTIKGIARMKLGKIHWLLLLLGIIVNLWGVLFINKFGWFDF